jgi:hypothetical protein
VRWRVLHGLRNEAVLAEALSAHNLPDSEPADVVLLANADGEFVTDREFILNHKQVGRVPMRWARPTLLRA